jgi:hypothetical protein
MSAVCVVCGRLKAPEAGRKGIAAVCRREWEWPMRAEDEADCYRLGYQRALHVCQGVVRFADRAVIAAAANGDDTIPAEPEWVRLAREMVKGRP